MFVPFIFTLDIYSRFENYFHWMYFYMYAEACSRNKWPMISHERYFERFSNVEETTFGHSIQDIFSSFGTNKVPTTEEMLTLKSYPILQSKEDALIAKYASAFDCWIALLKDENQEFEQMIGELLDRITEDFNEKPNGIMVFEFLPKSLLKAAQKREIPVVFQGAAVVRPPFAAILNAFSLINDSSAEALKLRYERFLADHIGLPLLSRKGLLRLFASERYMIDIHNIDDEPEYDVGVLYSNIHAASHHAGREFMSDREMGVRAGQKYEKVLLRTRPGYEPTEDATDDSPTCFHFCCKCKRVLGFMTKGMFEAMLVGRIAHEYGDGFFHSLSNDGIEDDSKGLAPIEFLNFVLFGMCTPFSWLTDPDYLRFLLSGPSEKDLYMRSLQYYTRSISQDDLEFYYMSDNRAYRLGDPLYFTSSHKPHEYASYYCTGGLCDGTGICTWSKGEQTSFAFDLTESITEPLTISVGLHDVAMDWNEPNPAQVVTCEVNGVDCGAIKLTPRIKHLRFTVPAECFTDKLQIIFRYSYLHSIEDFKISVAFKLMYISRPGQRPIEDLMLAEKDLMLAEVAGLKEKIEFIYNTRSWKLGNGIMKSVARVLPQQREP